MDSLVAQQSRAPLIPIVTSMVDGVDTFISAGIDVICPWLVFTNIVIDEPFLIPVTMFQPEIDEPYDAP